MTRRNPPRTRTAARAAQRAGTSASTSGPTRSASPRPVRTTRASARISAGSQRLPYAPAAPPRRASTSASASASTSASPPPPPSRDPASPSAGAEPEPDSVSVSESDAEADVAPVIVPPRDAKREQMHNARLADSVRRFRYLLGQTELFQHFIDIKKSKDPRFAALLEGVTGLRGNGGRKSGRGSRRRKGDDDEDELDRDEDDAFVFEQSPGYVKGGQLRAYQIDGLNWMISLYHHGINGILADEMGLGKTLQTISFLGYLKYMCNKPGFHLVVVPKSTLDNWRREFGKWIPGFNTVVLQGDKEERREILRERVLAENFDVLITTYEMCLKEKGPLLRISWEYIVIDEAHRIKNANSMLSQIVRAFESRGRLLITGTPLQNNLMELWALLNFLLPDVFSDAADFENWFAGKTGEKELEGGNEAKSEEQDAIVKQLHKVLRPFLLRRVKADVEKSLLPKKEINLFIGLTEMQRTWYKALLKKDVDAVTGINARKEGKSRLQNIVMQLRKCCNHPYLFEGAEPEGMDDEQHLIDNAGKMVILDKLLARMKEKGSRVLIFSQMGRMLDILSDYCTFRDYDYSRIDGSTAHEERVAAIDEFNAPDSKKFIFLLTTRAGGLGINLTTADVVVLYDSDWNPQADLQAMDRAHRIGQTKQVYVFRFVTEHTVEERVLERATQKLRLDQLVIQQGRHQEKQKAQQNKEDLVDAIKHGADKIINGEGGMLIDENIDNIISDGEKRTAALQARYQDVGIDVLNSIQNGERPDWRNQDGAEEADEEALNKLWMEPTKRERRTNYTEYYGNDPIKPKSVAIKVPKPPKQVQTPFYQFFPTRLLDLQRREVAAFQRTLGFRVPRWHPSEGETEDQMEASRNAKQAFIDGAEELNEDELQEKEELGTQGFLTWQKSDFWNFVRASEKHGMTAYAAIAEEVSAGRRHKRTEDEVRRYAEEFWSRGPEEVPDWDKIAGRIREGEAKVQKAIADERLLRTKMKQYSDPLRQIKLTYGSNKGQRYAPDQDKWLLLQLAEYGLQDPDVFERIHQEIRIHPLLRFDFWMKSRTIQEITRRCHKLIPIFLKGEPGYVDGTSTRKNGKGKRRAEAEAEAEVDDSADEADQAVGPAGKRRKTAA